MTARHAPGAGCRERHPAQCADLLEPGWRRDSQPAWEGALSCSASPESAPAHLQQNRLLLWQRRHIVRWQVHAGRLRHRLCRPCLRHLLLRRHVQDHHLWRRRRRARVRRRDAPGWLQRWALLGPRLPGAGGRLAARLGAAASLLPLPLLHTPLAPTPVLVLRLALPLAALPPQQQAGLAAAPVAAELVNGVRLGALQAVAPHAAIGGHDARHTAVVWADAVRLQAGVGWRVRAPWCGLSGGGVAGGSNMRRAFL